MDQMNPPQMGGMDRLLMALLGKDTGAAPAGPQDQALLNVYGRQPQQGVDPQAEAFKRLQMEQGGAQPAANPGMIQRALGSLMGR